MEKKVLVYQAYGSLDLLQQTKFSILSLLKHLPEKSELEVWIYTDQTKTFEDFFQNQKNIRCFELTPDQMMKWKGPLQFVHRLKIEMLIDAGKRFKGCLFYCDSDTYFLKSPTTLFSKVNDRISLMHVNEGHLDRNSDPLSKKILKFVKKHHFQIGNELVGIGPSTEMWNAGVIGIAEKNKYLLPLILELTDQTYALYQKHVMEQLAVSFYLQTKSSINAADDVVFHYWNQKPEYQQAINQFLSDKSDAQAALKQWESFQKPALTQKHAKRSLLKKILRKK
jgi:hypothetical protein